MKEVRKKSNDEALRSLLVKAFRQHTQLAWDRMETQQPQCGFGKQMICCTDCFDGPCRISPFATEEQQTVCGRDRSEMVVREWVSKVSDGTVSLVKLAASFGGHVKPGTMEAALAPADDMMESGDLTSHVQKLGNAAMDALAAIAEVRGNAYGQGPSTLEINLGALEAEAANIMVVGHVSPATIKLFADQSASAGAPVNLLAVCGSETSGEVELPILTNYQSQEVPLLTGCIDAIVAGEQCVMPAVKHLAAAMGIPVFYSLKLSGPTEVKQALAEAVKAFRRRAGKSVQIPEEKAVLQSGFSASGLDKALEKKTSGLVYLGGCGNMTGTQDAAVIKAAKLLVEAGYLVVTSGCVGASLAKDGLCDAAQTEGLPPVIHLGACTQSGVFLDMAKAARAKGVPVAAVLAEIVHNKTLAVAVAFACAGITTYIDTEVIIDDAKVASALGEEMAAQTGGRILPLPESVDLVGTLAGLPGKS